MYEDLKIFIKKIIEDKKSGDIIINTIEITKKEEWYDFVANFTENSKHHITSGSVQISSFDRQLRRKKLKKLKI